MTLTGTVLFNMTKTQPVKTPSNFWLTTV